MPTPTPTPADHAARCRELAKAHGFVVYDRPDGRGRYAFHPSRTALPLRFFEAAGEDWHGRPQHSRFFAPDLDVAAVLACAEFGHVTRLLEVPAPASSEPEQAPTPATAAPIVVASLAQLAELEATGRRVLMRDGYAGLARQASDLYCALYSLQSDGIRGAEDVDAAPLEDLCGLLQRLAADAREGREAA